MTLNPTTLERLSALFDGECDRGELDLLLGEMDRAPGLGQRWSRMCLARAALSGRPLPQPHIDLCASVMAAVALEATTANPGPSRRASLRAAGSRGRRAWRPLAGLAAAAMVAGVVVATGEVWLFGHSRSANAVIAAREAGQSSAALAAREAVVAVPVSARPAVDGDETRWTQLDPASARQLDSYLMEHSNLRAAQGMGGTLGYARLAVRTADYHPVDGSR